MTPLMRLNPLNMCQPPVCPVTVGHLPPESYFRSKKLINDSKSRFMFYDICNDSLSGMPSCLCTTIDDIYEDLNLHK